MELAILEIGEIGIGEFGSWRKWKCEIGIGETGNSENGIGETGNTEYRDPLPHLGYIK